MEFFPLRLLIIYQFRELRYSKSDKLVQKILRLSTIFFNINKLFFILFLIFIPQEFINCYQITPPNEY